MSGFELWFYRGLVAILVIVVWWAIRRFATQVTTKLDQLIAAIQELSGKNIEHTERLNQLTQQQTDHTSRLNDHSKRIRNLELKTTNNANGKNN